jgi:secondary thiamine-phosphate synthase enzyme
MRSEVLTFDTSNRDFVDITAEVASFAGDEGDGLVHVFAPHATAGIALMETGSGSEEDLRNTIDRLLPRAESYVHSHGSKGHGADHVLPAFISPSLSIPVVDGRLQLGTWQSIVFVDTNRDNPNRKVRLSLLRSD